MAWANRKVDAQCIVEIIPSLSEDVLQQLLEKLEECGVSTCDDLRYVRESDISSVPRPIHVRRLLAEWTSSGYYEISIVFSDFLSSDCCFRVF